MAIDLGEMEEREEREERRDELRVMRDEIRDRGGVDVIAACVWIVEEDTVVRVDWRVMKEGEGLGVDWRSLGAWVESLDMRWDRDMAVGRFCGEGVGRRVRVGLQTCVVWCLGWNHPVTCYLLPVICYL